MSLRSVFDKIEKEYFHKGAKFERLYPAYEALDTILFSTGKVAKNASHVRDGMDLKRMMFTVVVALAGCVFMAMYNTGLQAHRAIAAGAAPLDTWQTSGMRLLGMPFDPANLLACIVHGALYYLPVLAVTFAAGGTIEVIFAIVRRHEINEGFLVTGMLFPLILPATIPLWQAALGIVFGTLIGKEIFGGTGMNILNPALTARAFLFFGYPAAISGDKVWIAAQTGADGVSGATLLAEGATGGMPAIASGVAWMDAFVGLIPGSMGETSALACLLGAVFLILTGVGSWRIMLSVFVGSVAASLLLNAVAAPGGNPLFGVPWYWHVVLGGWAFGAVFMATDPVSASHTNTGRYIYGFLIGILAILIRVVNPAYPEGMMMAILFMNLFASFIDWCVVRANVRRRKARYAA